MINGTTKKPLRVWSEDMEWPWISLPLSQLADVRRLLDQHDIRYTVDENYLSINEGPFMALIRLGRGTNGRFVQDILDSIA